MLIASEKKKRKQKEKNGLKTFSGGGYLQVIIVCCYFISWKPMLKFTCYCVQAAKEARYDKEAVMKFFRMVCVLAL